MAINLLNQEVGATYKVKDYLGKQVVKGINYATIAEGQRILVPRLLCRHDRQKHGENCSVYPKSAEGGQVRRPTDHAREDVARLRAAGKDKMQMPVCPTRRDAWLVS